AYTLIKRLTSPTDVNVLLLDVVLLTFPYYFTPQEFFNLLLARFYSNEEYAMLQSIRMRVINTLKLWLSQPYFSDWGENDPLRNNFQQFCDVNLVIAGYRTLACHMLETLRRSMDEYHEALRVHDADPFLRLKPLQMSVSQIPKPMISSKHLSRLNNSNFKLRRLNPIEVARQLTLIEMDLFRLIQEREFISKSWSKPNKLQIAPNITRFITRFNRTGLWVASQTLQPTNAESRAKAMVFFIMLSNELLRLNNFNGLMAVLAGLRTPPVVRLKRSWNLLPPHVWDTWEYLDRLVDPANGYAALRAQQQQAPVPKLPHLGILLHDLVIIEETMPGEVPSRNGNLLINLTKYKRIFDAITGLLNNRHNPFPLQRVPALSDYLMDIRCLEESELYELSRRHEPRSFSMSPDRERAAESVRSCTSSS
ncbi:MAG: hypothetical protein K2Q09_03235, partial [Phycisphaerales bacterium]|nr:hypothetical protein [Phycisphaerales bacterium]